MRYILARANRDVLEAFARSKMLLALDFDGTLAPDRAGSRPGRAAGRRPAGCCGACPAAIPAWSSREGREPTCVRRLRAPGVADVIGNHGIEPSGRHGVARRRVVRRWLPQLRRACVRRCGRRDRGQGRLGRGSLPACARGARRRAPGSSRPRRGLDGGAAGRRQAGRQPAAGRRRRTRGWPWKRRGSAWPATRPSTWATTRPTRTSSRSTSRAGCWRSASAGSRGSAAGYYIRNQREIDRRPASAAGPRAATAPDASGGHARETSRRPAAARGARCRRWASSSSS